MSSPVLVVEGVRKRYGAHQVLHGVDLAVAPGEFVALLGPSGSGKTTLFACLTRLLEPDEGQVTVNGRPVTGTRGRGLAAARREIGMVFQQYNVAERLSALDNVLAGRLTHQPTWRAALRRFPDADRRAALAQLRLVGLEALAAQPAGTLSGGQQQRVAIARALAQQPRVLLADEPVSSLDPVAAEGVLSTLSGIAARDRVGVLCSLHQEHLATRFATRVVRLTAGRIVNPEPSNPAPQRSA